MEESDPRMSPPIKIKDEPIDEGYDAALLPQSSIRQIKEELEQQEVSVGRESYRHPSAVHVQLSVRRSFSRHVVADRVTASPSNQILISYRALISGGAEDQLCVLCRRRERLCSPHQ